MIIPRHFIHHCRTNWDWPNDFFLYGHRDELNHHKTVGLTRRYIWWRCCVSRDRDGHTKLLSPTGRVLRDVWFERPSVFEIKHLLRIHCSTASVHLFFKVYSWFTAWRRLHIFHFRLQSWALHSFSDRGEQKTSTKAACEENISCSQESRGRGKGPVNTSCCALLNFFAQE